MKNYIISLLAGAAIFASSASAEIVLTDDLSAYGYIDMSLQDNENADRETAVAEFELGLSFAPVDSKWSAVAEISFDNDSSISITEDEAKLIEDKLQSGIEEEIVSAIFDSAQPNNSAEFETVTITYAASDELSFTAGNILSYQGFETYDATGLYQFSYAGLDGSPLYSAGYAVGACVDYVTDDYALGAWVGDTDSDEKSYEFLAAYTGIEGLTVKAILADDPSYETTNIWASYDYNAFTFAAEVVDTEYENGDELDVMMALVYYSFGDAGLTVRVTDGEYNGVDYEKLTISPSYAFSDNVFGLIEVSSEDLGSSEQDSFAAELIYSF